MPIQSSAHAQMDKPKSCYSADMPTKNSSTPKNMKSTKAAGAGRATTKTAASKSKVRK